MNTQDKNCNGCDSSMKCGNEDCPLWLPMDIPCPGNKEKSVINNRTMVENKLCQIARWAGTLHGRLSARLPKLNTVILHYLIIQLLVIAGTVAYVEYGHDKGWKRADVWYTCLHTHHHFPWQ